MKRLTVCIIVLAVLATSGLAQRPARQAAEKVIQLTPPQLTGPVSLEQVIANRRSIRRFADGPISLDDISQLLWAGQGITEPGKGLRAAPSAGAIYPITLYVLNRDGIFTYNPEKHSLMQILDRDVRENLAAAALDQQVVSDAACDIVIAGSVRKLAVKYGSRAEKFMLLEAGHIAENILLQSVSLGLAAVPVGGFAERAVARVCKLSPNMEPLYIICLGQPETETPPEKVLQNKPLQQPKTAVLVVPSKNFRDEELFETLKVLSEASIQTVVAGTKTGLIKGTQGGQVLSEILLENLIIDNYDAVIFIGGPGTKELFNNRYALEIARTAKKSKKIIGAICIGPTILAEAGILKGVTVTSWPSERIKLRRMGATYTGAALEQDGQIITAKGPQYAEKFAKAIADAITEKRSSP